MASVIAGIAQDVLEVLTEAPAGTFPLPFAAARTYQPHVKVADLADARVTVFPGPHERERVSRGAVQRTYTVAVLVQRRVTAETNEQIDPLMELCERIADFVGPGFVGESGPAWVATELDPIYDPEHMKEHMVFTNTVLFRFTL